MLGGPKPGSKLRRPILLIAPHADLAEPSNGWIFRQPGVKLLLCHRLSRPIPAPRMQQNGHNYPLRSWVDTLDVVGTEPAKCSVKNATGGRTPEGLADRRDMELG